MNISVDTIDTIVNLISLSLGAVVAILGWIQRKKHEDSRAHSIASMLTVLLGIVIIVFGVVSRYTGNYIQSRSNAELKQAKADADKASELASLLEEKIEPRVITTEQNERFSELVSSSPKGKVWVLTFAGADPEAVMYADKVRKMISGAGYNTKGKGRLIIQPRPMPIGCIMYIRSKTPEPIVTELHKALLSIGFEIKLGIDPDMKEDAWLLIGIKPQ